MKYLFIDIRKSDEVYQKRFGESTQYDVYNIPMDMIRFNNKTLSAHLEYFKEIYIYAIHLEEHHLSKINIFQIIQTLKCILTFNLLIYISV